MAQADQPALIQTSPGYQQWHAATSAYLKTAYKETGTYGVINPAIQSNGYWLYRGLRINQTLGAQRLPFDQSGQWAIDRLTLIMEQPEKAFISLQSESFYLLESLAILNIAFPEPQTLASLIQALQQPQGYFLATTTSQAEQPTNQSDSFASTYFSLRILDRLGYPYASHDQLFAWIKTEWRARQQANDPGSLASLLVLIELLKPTSALPTDYSWDSILSMYRAKSKIATNYSDLGFDLSGMLGYAEYTGIAEAWLEQATIDFINDPVRNHDGLIVDSNQTPDLLFSEMLYRAAQAHPTLAVNQQRMQEFLQRQLMPDGSFYPVVLSEDDVLTTVFAYQYARLFPELPSAATSDLNSVIAHLLEKPQLRLEELYSLSMLDVAKLSATNQQLFVQQLEQAKPSSEADLQQYFFYLSALNKLKLPITDSLKQQVINVVEGFKLNGNYGVEGTITAYHTAMAVILYSYLGYNVDQQAANINWIRQFLETLEAQNSQTFTVREVYLLLLALNLQNQPLPHVEALTTWMAACLPPAGNSLYQPFDPAQQQPDFYVLPYTLAGLRLLGIDIYDQQVLSGLMQP
ncbi:hypothetical protein SE18_08030 [Herpetosiphon geysericola]|uniref:Prenyltransferase alpha-alpha toroid domain-containing protein n=2 Tax=Herpetosiphon geysericola TaxID=70996 RepID=A0A0P6XZ37_9CHLR|nr:hypothetical protein SE18_08030 [Herpetosiphon geysericola]